jgi:magnesium transporter
MIKVFYRAEALWRCDSWEKNEPPARNIWIDLISPSADEVAKVQSFLSIEIPSRAEMQEIEASSRLYQENGAYFMTATAVISPDHDSLESSAVTFILSEAYLVTVRYLTPKPFDSFAARIQKPGSSFSSSTDLLIGLLETIIDRMADILEMHSAEVERISRAIFSTHGHREAPQVSLQETIKDIGIEGNHVSILRESLVSVSRMAIYLNQAVAQNPHAAALRETLKEISQDLASLADHASFMSSKVNFILDATLGMINIEQNKIIKLFSVAAVVFLPPTLIASIYGMNFQLIPELSWPFGYPLALLLMVVSAILPYTYFKRKGWL